MLARSGFVVVGEARDGQEAVDLARATEPDVAVLDLRMPILDGIEAARRIYAERPLPIVMLTAFADRAHVDEAIAAGVFTYLVKPFKETDVVPALRAAVRRHEELLAARRGLGAQPPQAEPPVELELPSQSGHTWPIAVRRRADGGVDVALADQKERA
jgi:AmiR/NasT family two-component response regulator